MSKSYKAVQCFANLCVDLTIGNVNYKEKKVVCLIKHLQCPLS